MAKLKTPAVLIVRDGWGRNPHPEHAEFNAIVQANTPRGDALLRDYPWAPIHTSGEDVGLPEGTMGNSEVGHQNIGAGRIVDQDSVRVTKAIRDGSFYDNEALVGAVNQAVVSAARVHLLGIASDAGVHGLMDHLYACLELCKRQNMPADRVVLHLFTDGRDTGPFSGRGYVNQIVEKCGEIGMGVVGSVCGRYYAMDRDNRWERVARAYACLTGRDAEARDVRLAPTADDAIGRYYDSPTNDSQQGDEFIAPTMIGVDADAAAATRIQSGDSVIFYNYRGDRPREITKAFVLDDDAWARVPESPDTGNRGFDRGEKMPLRYVTMTAYEQGLPVAVAYPKPPRMANILGAWLEQHGVTQFRCAETEKFPHVTFFFSDYRETPFEGEGREMAQSPKVATYDLQPEMSAPEVRDLVLGRLDAEDGEQVIIVNFANGDMVGHTAKHDAVVKAVETVDACVGAIVDATLAKGGFAIVTADHGNAEQTFDPETGKGHTAHTTYDVDCILVDDRLKSHATGDPDTPSPAMEQDGRLADLAPTLLALMGLDRPAEMTGRPLITSP